jgi:hypothetical protein
MDMGYYRKGRLLVPEFMPLPAAEQQEKEFMLYLYQLMVMEFLHPAQEPGTELRV